MHLPTFETARLIVRPRTPADTEACMEMDRDPEVTRFIPGPWSDIAAHRAHIEQRTRGPYPDGLGYWSVVDRGNPDQFLGWVSLIPYDALGPQVEIGWRFRRAAWGRGYATEAAAPVLRHGMITLALDEVVADIDPDNTASIRVATKLNFRLRETKLKPEYTIGYYGLSHREWSA